MLAIRIVATVLALVMGTAIIWAAVGGDFSGDGNVILGLRWGVVSIIDIYVGAAVVAIWIWWRDGLRAGVIWVVALVVLGHLATAGYVAWRAWSVDSVQSLLMGRRLSQSHTG